MNNKRVLVIGGAGFIGKNLCRIASDNGYKVTSFDRITYEPFNDNVVSIEGDFYDYSTLCQYIGEADIVVHALSIMTPSNSNQMYLKGYENELIQTVKICDYISKMDKMMVFLSSGGTVYGDAGLEIIPESAPLNPINHYGALKVCIETVMKAFNSQRNAKLFVARISNPYGPGQDYKSGVGFIDAIIRKFRDNDTLEIWGDGEVVRDYIYIDDVCNMFLALFEYTGDERVFNFSTGVGHSQNDILGICRDLGMAPTVRYIEARAVDVRRNVLDNSRIKLVYKGDIKPLNEGIKIVIDSL